MWNIEMFPSAFALQTHTTEKQTQAFLARVASQSGCFSTSLYLDNDFYKSHVCRHFSYLFRPAWYFYNYNCILQYQNILTTQRILKRDKTGKKCHFLSIFPVCIWRHRMTCSKFSQLVSVEKIFASRLVKFKACALATMLQCLLEPRMLQKHCL